VFLSVAEKMINRMKQLQFVERGDMTPIVTFIGWHDSGKPRWQVRLSVI